MVVYVNNLDSNNQQPSTVYYVTVVSVEIGVCLCFSFNIANFAGAVRKWRHCSGAAAPSPLMAAATPSPPDPGMLFTVPLLISGLSDCVFIVTLLAIVGTQRWTSQHPSHPTCPGPAPGPSTVSQYLLTLIRCSCSSLSSALSQQCKGRSTQPRCSKSRTTPGTEWRYPLLPRPHT